MRVSHVTFLSLTMAATTVDEMGFESDASWNTVSASTALVSARTSQPEALHEHDFIAIDDGEGETGHFAGVDETLRHLLDGRQAAHHGVARHRNRNAIAARRRASGHSLRCGG